MPNAKVLAKKQSDAEELKSKFEKSKLVILADYRGINVEDITKIRADLKKTESEYVVAKNSTLRFAVKGTDVDLIAGLGAYKVNQINGNSDDEEWVNDHEILSKQIEEAKADMKAMEEKMKADHDHHRGNKGK